MDDRDDCEIVEAWNDSIGPADVYRRPEALEFGIGRGVVGDSSLVVLLAGVPVSPDPLKKRWPGVAPREWALADLIRDVNRTRFGLGLPPFERSEALDEEAQRLAAEILEDPERAEAGSFRTGDAIALYFRGAGPYVQSDGFAVKAWFKQHRGLAAVRTSHLAGAGLASRGRDGRLYAAWVLVIGPAAD